MKKKLLKAWGIGIAVSVLLVIVVVAFGGDSPVATTDEVKNDTPAEVKKEEKPEPKQEEKPKEEPKKEVKREAISEKDAELYCQDARLLNKYVHLDKTTIIDIWNYNKRYEGDWGFDSEGNPIVSLSWNGKDKTDGSALRFICWVAGTKDNIRLMQMDIGGVTVHAIPFYDANGKQVE